MTTILGEKISLPTMEKIIGTKPGGFLGYKNFAWKVFYWELIKE